MKVTVKDLKQRKFTIDVEPTDQISALKQKISDDQGWEPKLQKLIYSGKILKDEETVQSYGIEEKGFVVCVVNKPKPTPAPASSAAETSTAAPPATPAPAASSTPAAPVAPVQTTSTSAAPATPTPAGRPTDSNALIMGAERAEAVANMEAMGFERSQIDTAMRAAFYNPDRAVEYLLSGIPENALGENAAAVSNRGAQGAIDPAGAATGADVAVDEEDIDLFDLAAQQGRGVGVSRGLGGGPAAAVAAGQLQGLGNLEFLRSNPQFQQLRQLVQQQPAMLEPILQQLGAGNPQLAQLIAQNPDQFLNILGENGGDNDAPLPPGAQSVSVTEEERDAIERLCRLGFDRDQAIQAYFACDKNEELAANFLFDQPEDDDHHSNAQ